MKLNYENVAQDYGDDVKEMLIAVARARSCVRNIAILKRSLATIAIVPQAQRPLLGAILDRSDELKNIGCVSMIGR